MNDIFEDYKSPITVDFKNQILQEQENQIMCKIKTVIDIDKDELIKMVNYDRNQYEAGYKAGIRKMRQHAQMDSNKLSKIREILINKIIQNPNIMFNEEIRGSDELQDNEVDLIEVIVDLYEYLHQEVLHEEYDYFFHFANKIGSDVDTGNFDKLIEKELAKNGNKH